MPEQDFAGNVAFITGGAVGFGRAFARALAAGGAAIAVADIDDLAAQRLVDELRAGGHRALAVHCDVGDEDQVEAAVAAVEAGLGDIGILLNNAGKHLTKYNQPFSVLSRSDVRALFETNVIGVVNCTVACRASMQRRGGGVVVNISSIASHLSTSPYGVSKLAVRGLTMAFAQEFAAEKIRVNAIAPGLMATENAVADLPAELLDTFVNNLQLIHRLGQMSDIVDAMLFLCSQQSSFITGETIKVSGGYPNAI